MQTEQMVRHFYETKTNNNAILKYHSRFPNHMVLRIIIYEARDHIITKTKCE